MQDGRGESPAGAEMDKTLNADANTAVIDGASREPTTK